MDPEPQHASSGGFGLELLTRVLSDPRARGIDGRPAFFPYDDGEGRGWSPGDSGRRQDPNVVGDTSLESPDQLADGAVLLVPYDQSAMSSRH